MIVTTAGGIEEDFIKCLAPTFLGDFSLSGKDLKLKGINRIGNLLVPNDNYCKFEEWLMPILDTMLEEQKNSVSLFIPTCSGRLRILTVFVIGVASVSSPETINLKLIIYRSSYN